MNQEGKSFSTLLQEVLKLDGKSEQKDSEPSVLRFQLENFFNNLPILAYKISPDGNILDCNISAVQSLGYDHKKELQGKPLIPTIYAAGSREKAKKLFVELKKKRIIRDEEMRAVTKRGKTIDVLLNAYTIRDEVGDTLCSLHTLTDISKQKEYQEILKKLEPEDKEKKYIKSEFQCSRLFEASPMALMIEDWSKLNKYMDGLKKSGVEDLEWYFDLHEEEIRNLASKIEIIRINKAALDLFEAVDVEEYRRGHFKSMNEEIHLWLREILLGMAAEESAGEREFPIKTFHNHEKIIRLKWCVDPDYEKTYSMVFVFVIDKTARKKLETELKKSEASLREQKKALEHKNIALIEVLSQVESEIGRIKEDISKYIEGILFPMLEKYKNKPLKEEYIELLKNLIEDIASSHGLPLRQNGADLTQKEMEVCNLIRGGLSNKEISSFLCVSCRTIEKHRERIRQKFGISKKAVNLAAFLHNH